MHIDAEKSNLYEGYKLYADGSYVGYALKATHGPGFFVELNNVKFKNAPGARYDQELAPRSKTWAPSLSAVKKLTNAVLTAKGKMTSIVYSYQMPTRRL
jgi:hypothetical protein